MDTEEVAVTSASVDITGSGDHQVLETTKAGAVVTSSNSNVHVEAVNVESAKDLGHVIIYTPGDDGEHESAVDLEHLDTDGPPAHKRFRVEQEDGQTYILTVSDPEAALALQEGEAGSGDAAGAGGTSDQLFKNIEVSQTWFTNKDDKAVLQSKGLQWKQGQWSKEEVDTLQENIASYCKEHNVTDPTEVIFETSKDERKDFYRQIAKGLERPLFSVYRRVIRMYDQKNHMGKYSQEEIAKLKDLREKYGTDWARIGQLLGRSAASVKDRCRLMKDTCNSGKWSPDEERRLTESVYELSGAQPGESVTTGLSWAAVAEKVGTRSEKQCRTKWLNYLNWKQKGGSEWTREDDIHLVLKVIETELDDENQIDWESLSKNWTSARSPQWLRGKWWSLKRHIPDYQSMGLQEVAQNLHQMHAQNIRSKPQSNTLRLSSLPRVSVMQQSPSGVLHVPIAVQSGQTATMSEDADGQYQAYELVQGLPTTSGAYLITQPQNNPHISFATGSMATDHIIVHTLPIGNSQLANSLQDSGNVAVQMNNQQHVVNVLQTIETTEQDLEPTEQQVEISHEALQEQGLSQVVGTSGLTVSKTLTGEIVLVPAGEASADTEPITNELVLTSSADTQYVHATTDETELINMTSLTDPMLPSESSALIDTAGEAENKTPNDAETDTPDATES